MAFNKIFNGFHFKHATLLTIFAFIWTNNQNKFHFIIFFLFCYVSFITWELISSEMRLINIYIIGNFFCLGSDWMRWRRLAISCKGIMTRGWRLIQIKRLKRCKMKVKFLEVTVPLIQMNVCLWDMCLSTNS